MKAAVLVPVCVAAFQVAGPSSPRLTVLYDNYPFDASCATGWGFSALVEGVGRTILFDTGAEAAAFQRNADRLKVNLETVDLIFISHDHGDHTGGLAAALPTRRIGHRRRRHAPRARRAVAWLRRSVRTRRRRRARRAAGGAAAANACRGRAAG